MLLVGNLRPGRNGETKFMSDHQHEHWMPEGATRVCELSARTLAGTDQIILNGRNGTALWRVTPILNRKSKRSPTHMLLLLESPPERGDVA
jgi:hypothetical protein